MGLDQIEAYLLLGSNLGDSKQLLSDALALIEEKAGEIFATSALYETEAWGKTDQPNFINMAVGIKTTLPALKLLHTLLAIEAELGRIRIEKWGERTMDIDLIFYGSEVINMGADLQVPHLEMQNRKFVLEPLAEIAPAFIHPVLKRNVSEILTTLKDTLSVSRI
ncbi:MAG: 2-amino-4-hydroxy-6-hydroxymethyldihydropteridine diphosphokinase [Flavobacterium sp.]|nr:MAG: 2-amino-4-hydroxy-6-hydroxymethyldihydropteridine diphosphokinase [Flavobacterium sp.]